ncbi:peptide deformylase [Legionella hackeliae]|uniref:Peptide deformylase n=1 Tax=Legionella hackeliae TaxID=449 RepID=A0A0A8UT58_LEGHA|nr:peptide deformylase [Legionella hackeliae]KTD12514.1 polypeptide deformylase [Legionella hackeliae]CEK11928.1 Peptide deformylase 1 [Legionella hackeliae]STX48700.1 polypeptide deformylase [Legionella hackeliae]
MSLTIHALEIVTIEQSQFIPMLKTPAETVTFPLSADNLALIQMMKEKLFQLGGVGLAAPQVNHHQQIVAIYIPEDAALLRNNVIPYAMHILINPSYQGIEAEGFVDDFEACYSVASKAGKVPRYKKIHLHYYDENGVEHKTTESGFYARVLQHEIDHLKGLLITDRLTPDCIQGSVDDMMALRRAELTDVQKERFDELMKRKFKNK